MSASLPLDTVLLLLLGSVRMVALLFSAPIFGHMAVSSRVRVTLAIAVMAALPIEPAPGFVPGEAPALVLVGAALREVGIGAAIGFGTRLLFGAFSLFGEIVSIESGLSHARVLDPNTGGTSVALASLFDLFVIGVFFAVGGHHMMIRTFAHSFEAWPIGGPTMVASVFVEIARFGGALFDVALQLAMPIVVAMSVSNLALGILARSIPQLNLMMLQLPAHVVMGLAMLSFGAGSLIRASGREIEAWSERLLQAIGGA